MASGDLSGLLAIEAVTPDGLLLTRAGTWVRYLEVDRVAQPLTAGVEGRRLHRSRMQTLAGRLKPHQGMQLTVTADPVALDTLVARTRQDVEQAAAVAAHTGHPDLSVAMTRMGAAEAQTLRRHANPRAAQEIKYVIAVPWRPNTPIRHQPSGPQPARGNKPRTVKWREHERAARDSWRELTGLCSELDDMNPRVLSGGEILALLHHRMNPGTPTPTGGFEHLTAELTATNDEAATATRQQLLEAVAGTSRLKYRGHDIYHHTGHIERVMRLNTSPDVTTPWWLMGLLDVGLPYRLSVHLHATSRQRERMRQRARYRRLRATRLSRERRLNDVSPEHLDAEYEAALLDAELHSSGRSGLYDASLYLSVIEPYGDQDNLDETCDKLLREFTNQSDAELRSCGGLARTAFASTLPLAVDRLGATRRYAAKNIGDLLPLVGSRCGTDDGVPLGLALPGRTLERLDPFDPAFSTAVGTITGLSGQGKTLTCARLLKMWLSRGATVRIIDRSSTEHPDDGGRGQGHYEPLASLIPGARVLHLGASGQNQVVICPWDTPDPGNVGPAKIEFLSTLHQLWIGQRAAGTHDRVLDAIEQSLLERAIAATYNTAASTGQRPCEQLLINTLGDLADEAASGNNQDAERSYRLLAERLKPYGEGGVYGHLANAETDIDDDAPFVVYDMAGVPAAMLGPLSLAIIEREEREIAQRRAHQLQALSVMPGGSWTGRSVMVIEEGWSQLEHDIAGRWLNEWARRVRHLAACLLAVSQHLSDFQGEQGAALRRQAAFHIIHRLRPEELELVAADLRLDPEEIDVIANLKREKGEYSTAYLVSDRGRGPVRLQMAEIEYWMLSADPRADQPLRAQALRETGGDPWQALRLLAEDDWLDDRRPQTAGT